jgi:hypothetical protein
MAGSAFTSTPFVNSLINGTAKTNHYKSKGLPNIPTYINPEYARVASGSVPRVATRTTSSTTPKSTPSKQVAPTANQGGSGSSPAPDPWASTVWGSKANYDRAVGDYNAAKATTYGSITDATNQASNNYKSSILDFLDSYKAQQGDINRSNVQNELARRQGSRSVLDMVGNGIRSGGITLNNANATNSSAAEAIAKAYGEMGRREQTQVNNQFAMGQDEIANAQAKLAALTETQKRHFSEDKVTTVNGIVNDATNQLAALNQAAASASLPDRIAIEQEKARIRQETLTALSQYDALLSQLAKPASAEDNRKKAAALDTAGTAADNAFQYDTTIPTELQGTGPFASTLPIFTLGR